MEGGAERAILDVLLENKLLIYNYEDLLEEELITERSARKFERNYLNHDFEGKKVKIYRILDSKRELFNLDKEYDSKVSKIINLYTTPEIEILFIIYFDDLKHFNNTKKKPSEFVKENYRNVFGEGNIKSYENVYNFWRETPVDLVAVVRQYCKLSHHKFENTLACLLTERAGSF